MSWPQDVRGGEGVVVSVVGVDMVGVRVGLVVGGRGEEQERR